MAELQKLQECEAVLNLKVVKLVDRDVLSFLASCEVNGIPSRQNLQKVFVRPYDWLSRDNAEVAVFINDSLCFASLKSNSMPVLLRRVPAPCRSERDPEIRKDLPIYIFFGSNDPVGQRLEGVRALVERYRSAGIHQSLTISIPVAGTRCCTK